LKLKNGFDCDLSLKKETHFLSFGMEHLIILQHQQRQATYMLCNPSSASSTLYNNSLTMKKVSSIPTIRATTGSSQLHFKTIRRAQSCQKIITQKQTVDPESPEALVRQLVGVRRPHPTTALFVRVHPSEERLQAFTNEKVDAVRNNNVETLRRMHQQGQSLDACSKNGESLLHLACRRGTIETVQFLVQVVPTTIQDELGRTILHDVCWRPRPDPALFMVVFHAVPRSFLLTPDARGHTCFDYCRKTEWPLWNAHLKEHLPRERQSGNEEGPVDPF
jgi:hypothetical protein